MRDPRAERLVGAGVRPRLLFGIRNKIVHEYFDVDWAVVWETVKNGLPPVNQQIDSILFDHRLALAQSREKEDEPKQKL